MIHCSKKETFKKAAKLRKFQSTTLRMVDSIFVFSHIETIKYK